MLMQSSFQVNNMSNMNYAQPINMSPNAFQNVTPNYTANQNMQNMQSMQNIQNMQNYQNINNLNNSTSPINNNLLNYCILNRSKSKPK